MKKIIFLFVLFVTCYMLQVTGALAEDIVKGERAEEIDGMLHKVEYVYGSPLFLNQESMLKNLNVEVYPEDRISAFPDPSFGLGSRIIIKRANAVVVIDAGQEKTFRTWKTTISEVLQENNVSVGDKDLIEPNQETKLASLLTSQNRAVLARDGREAQTPVIAKVSITRVAETEIKKSEAISYKVISKKDPELEKGQTRVDQEGSNGKKELTYKVRRENGQEVSRVLVKTEVIKEPLDKIIVEGTKVAVYGTGKATWYDWIGGMTAASNTLPYGTMVHVINLENGKSVDVKIVDHGIKGSAIIDLSDQAFAQLAPLGKGTIQVRLEKL